MMSVVVYSEFGSNGKGLDEETPLMVLVLVLGGAGGGAAEDAAEGMNWFGVVGVWAAAVACSPATVVGGS